MDESQQHILTLPFEILSTYFSHSENDIEESVEFFESTGVETWKSIRSSTQRVLMIANQFSTMDEAMSILMNQSFYENFNKAQYFFVIILEVNDLLEDIETSQLENFSYEKPLIISFESGQQSLIYYKEANDCEFVKFEENEKLSEVDFLQEIRENFDLKLLLKALKSKLCGAFNGTLSGISVNPVKCFNSWRLIDHAAHHNNILCLRFLNLFNFNLKMRNEDQKRVLEIAAQYCDSHGFAALLELPIDSNFDDFYMTPEDFHLLKKRSINDYSLLMIASKTGNNKIFDHLLVREHDVNRRGKDGETAASLAWRNKHFDFLAKLIEANSKYPENFDNKFEQHKKHNEKKMAKLCAIVDKTKIIFGEIEKGSCDEVVRILMEEQSFRCMYNINNQPSQIFALQKDEIEIFAFLKSIQKRLNPEESQAIQTFIDIFYNDNNDKTDLRDAYKKYHITSEDSYLMELSKKTRLGLNHSNDDGIPYFKFIRQAFDELNEIEWIRPILKIVSKAKKSDIIFDFNHDSVEELDPTQDEKTMGIAYYVSGYIYIGAKSLLEEERKYESLGTLAHELTHYAMQLTYGNKCKPYAADDDDNEEQFQEIVEIFQSNQSEPYINVVYEYARKDRPAELIVRVPHLLALYKDDPINLTRVKKSFGILFKYFQKTLIDVEKKIELLDIIEQNPNGNPDEGLPDTRDPQNDSDSSDDDVLSKIKKIGDDIGDSLREIDFDEAGAAVEVALNQIKDGIEKIPDVAEKVGAEIAVVLPTVEKEANRVADQIASFCGW